MRAPSRAGDKAVIALSSVLVITAAVQLAGRFTDPPPLAPLKSIGDDLPAAELTDLRTSAALPGGLDRLVDDLPAPCVVLYFFDPNCPACRESAPEWAGINHVPENQDIGVAWVLVSGGREAALEFLMEFGITAPAVAVMEDRASQHLGLPGVPTAWAVNVERRIEFVRVGVAGVSPTSLGGTWCDDAA